jgi:trypsin
MNNRPSSTLAALLLASLTAFAAQGCSENLEESSDAEETASSDSAIVGGTVAASGSWVGTAALYSGSTQICGGTLAAPGWVITAAHCVEPTSADGGISRVVLGRNTLSSTTSGESITVLKATRHPSYDATTMDNDIALLQLSAPAKTAPVKVVSSATFASVSSTATVTVVGWGLTRENAFSTSNRLRQVDVPLVPLAQCQGYPRYNIVTANQLCAGLPTGGKDSCQGDSGGPLYAKIGTSTYLAGVVSWGIGCARANAPGVYTKVANYEAWLSTETQGAITAL